MSPPVMILGAGGHARVLAESLRRLDIPVIGLVEAGGDDRVLAHPSDAIALVNGIGSLEPGSHRKVVFETWKGRGYGFAHVVDPHAVLAQDTVLGEGAQVMAGAVIQPGCVVGANAVINTGARIDHDCRLGPHVHVAPGVTLSGGVEVGEDSHLGTGCTVIQGIRIGTGCLIAAGAVVVGDVPDGTRMAGVPARPF